MQLLEVMEPIISNKVMLGEDWIHQIKWDGIRGITYIDHRSFRLFTKSGRERTDFYPEISDTVTLLNGHQAIFDGELVVFDPQGKPSFNLVLTRDRLKSRTSLSLYTQKYPVNYIIFDILFFNGNDLRFLPLSERKQILKEQMNQNSCIGITDDYSDGLNIYNLMKEKNFEGIVSKKKDSIYLPGKKHDLWVKTKISKKILAVIGGISWKANMPNSLLLGIYTSENVISYVGRASIGLTEADFRTLKEYSQSLKQDVSPFSNLPKAKDVTWFKPILTCWVSFLEWTDGSSLRHPKILGFSSKKATSADGKEYVVE